MPIASSLLSETHGLAQRCPGYSYCLWLLYYGFDAQRASADWSMAWRKKLRRPSLPKSPSGIGRGSA